jgi:preprotein translocase subunit YajC
MSRSDLVVTTTGGMWGTVRVVENPRMTTTTAEDVDMRGVIDVSVFVFGARF